MSEVSTPPAAEAPPAQSPPPSQGQAQNQGAPQSPPANPAADRRRGDQRRRLFLIVGAVVLSAALIFFLYWLLVLSHYVSTDDAYVGADVAEVTPQVSGAVLDVRVADTQAVKKGDILAVIDPADAKVAAARAEAGYGSATRRVEQNFSSNDALSAQILARDADLARAHAQTTAAESDVAKAKVDLERREALASTGAVSGEELTTARNAYQTAVANLSAA